MMDLWHYNGIQAECPAQDCDHRGDFLGVKHCPKCGVEIVILLATKEGFRELFGEEPRQKYTGPQLVQD